MSCNTVLQSLSQDSSGVEGGYGGDVEAGGLVVVVGGGWGSVGPLSVVLLPRPMDLLEQRHGESHAQELQDRK